MGTQEAVQAEVALAFQPPGFARVPEWAVGPGPRPGCQHHSVSPGSRLQTALHWILEGSMNKMEVVRESGKSLSPTPNQLFKFSLTVTSLPLSLSGLRSKMGVVTAMSSGLLRRLRAGGAQLSKARLCGQTAFPTDPLVDIWAASTF